MNKKISAIIMGKGEEVLVCHYKDTENINRNWELPTWDMDIETTSSSQDFLFQKLKDSFQDNNWKIITQIEVEDNLFYVLRNSKVDFNSISFSKYDLCEYRPWEIVKDLSNEDNFYLYRKAFLRLRRFLEPSYKRWIRICVKLLAAIVLLLLPFAIVWNILKNQ